MKHRGLGKRDADVSQTGALLWRYSWACKHTTLRDESRKEGEGVLGPQADRTQGTFEACLI